MDPAVKVIGERLRKLFGAVTGRPMGWSLIDAFSRLEEQEEVREDRDAAASEEPGSTAPGKQAPATQADATKSGSEEEVVLKPQKRGDARRSYYDDGMLPLVAIIVLIIVVALAVFYLNL